VIAGRRDLLWRAVPQPDDGRQQLTAMADAGNAQFFKVVRGEIAQYFGADVVLAKRHLVALKAEASQPACYVHRRSSGSVMLKAEYRRDDRQCPEPENQPSGRMHRTILKSSRRWRRQNEGLPLFAG
jgi:hypothetical protein